MNDVSPAFQRMQALAAYVRNPERAALPDGLPSQRVKLYRSLYLNNINELLSSTLSMTCAHTPLQVWRHWVETFYDLYPHSTPYFMEIAGEFVQFLISDRIRHVEESSYLIELAHFEWVQLALSVDDNEMPSDVDANMSLLTGVPVMVPASAVVAYEHPIHDVERMAMPTTTFLLLYRDAEDQSQCLTLAPFTAHLLDAIKQNETATGQQLIDQVALAASLPLTGDFMQSALHCLNDMRLRGILLGCRSTIVRSTTGRSITEAS